MPFFKILVLKYFHFRLLVEQENDQAQSSFHDEFKKEFKNMK